MIQYIFIVIAFISFLISFFIFKRQLFTVIKFKILIFLDIVLKIKGIKYGYFILGKKNKFDYPRWAKLPYIVRKIIDILAINKVRVINKKTLAILKLDAIGDYVLFHNFLKIIRNSKEYHDHKILLVGNFVWKDIFNTFDKESVDNTFFINKNKFSKNLIYRFKTLSILNKYGIETTLVPVLSRDFLFYDTIVYNFQSTKNITFDSNFSNISKEEKNISDNYYNMMIEPDTDIKFEFERNKEFVEKLLKENLTINKPFFDKELIKSNLEIISNKYAVICPGAGEKSRIWKYNNFFEVAKYIENKYMIQVIICGSKDDADYSKKITQLSDNNFIDLCGQTSLTDMIYILSKAKLLIAHDSSALHFGASCNINIILISNGKHFGRFTPYPAYMASNIQTLYPPGMEDIDNNFQKYCKDFEHSSKFDINSISVERVKEKVDTLLKENNDEYTKSN